MDEDAEDIKKKKLEELKKEKEASEEEAEKRMEAQKKAILRKIMTSEARERLGRVRVARPQVAENLESQLVMLAQKGAINGKIDDEKLKELLKKITESNKKEINIRRK